MLLLRFIYFYTCKYSLCILTTVQYSFGGFIYSFTSWRTFDIFVFIAITNDMAINIFTCLVDICTRISLVYIPKSRIAWSQDMNVFNLLDGANLLYSVSGTDLSPNSDVSGFPLFNCLNNPWTIRFFNTQAVLKLHSSDIHEI